MRDSGGARRQAARRCEEFLRKRCCAMFSREAQQGRGEEAGRCSRKAAACEAGRRRPIRRAERHFISAFASTLPAEQQTSIQKTTRHHVVFFSFAEKGISRLLPAPLLAARLPSARVFYGVHDNATQVRQRRRSARVAHARERSRSRTARDDAHPHLATEMSIFIECARSRPIRRQNATAPPRDAWTNPTTNHARFFPFFLSSFFLHMSKTSETCLMFQ